MTVIARSRFIAVPVACILSLLWPLPSSLSAQPRGRALFDLLGGPPLTRLEGITQPQWLPGGRSWLATVVDTVQPRSRLLRVDAATGQRVPLLPAAIADVVEPTFQRLTVTGDGLSLLIFTRDAVHRLDGVSGARTVLALPPKALSEARAERAFWSPDGTAIAWVDDSRIAIAETRDGAQQFAALGEGEAVGLQSSIMWSPDGSRLAFVRGDASTVPKYAFQFGPGTARPVVQDLRLRWAGQPLTRLSVQLIERTTAATRVVELGADSNATYVPWLQWRDGSRELLVLVGNRRQNAMELIAIDAVRGARRSIVRETVPSFLDFPGRLTLLPGGREIIWPSERTGWRHFYVYDVETGALVRPLTSGAWPVNEAIGADSAGRWLYFSGFPDGPLEERVLRVPVRGGAMHALNAARGTQAATISPGAHFVALQHSTLTEPTRIDVHDANARLVRPVLTTNTTRLDSLRLVPPEIVTITAADGVTILHGQLFKPADFDPSKRYPVLVSFMYTGPHYQRVRNWWSGFAGIGELRLAQAGFLVWKLDSRGTPNRGQVLSTASFGQLGRFEIEDHVASLTQLAATRPYVDLDRVGVFGDSYGGQLTLHAISRHPRLFKAAVIGSPVVDWNNYFASYSEKYLGLPAVAASAYTASSPIGAVDSVRTPMLLAHGLSDANVVPNHAFRLVQTLVNAGKGSLVETMFYPDQGHVFAGNAQADYHRRRLEFFMRHLLQRPLDTSQK